MATPSPSIAGKGMLFVTSRISRPNVLDVPTYIKWYEEDHIAEVVETSGINSARRFVHVDPKAEKPYLAMYALDDLAFLLSDEFRKIRVQSDILPSPGIIYDLADVDVRYDNLVHVYDRTQKGRGAAKALVVVASRLKEGVSPQDLDRWYREEVRSLCSSASYSLMKISRNTWLTILHSTVICSPRTRVICGPPASSSPTREQTRSRGCSRAWRLPQTNSRRILQLGSRSTSLNATRTSWTCWGCGSSRQAR